MRSSGDLPEEKRIAPGESSPGRFRSNTAEVVKRRTELVAFPARDGRLRSSRDLGHLGLSDAKYVDANQSDAVHTSTYIRRRINNQQMHASALWGVDIPSRIFCDMEDVSTILRAIMDARGWNQDDLAHHVDTTQATVSRWLGGAEPKGRNMERIRELALESGVIDRPSVAANRVDILGRVGAGALIDVEHDQSGNGYDSVELPFSYPDPIIAFEIEGVSQLPVYEPGQVIVCLRDQVRATDSYLGMPVVVRLSTGERYLKRLAKGSAKGRYNLESWNARTIEDVRVEWVGEIIATVNRTALRRIERRNVAGKVAGKNVGRG